MLVKRDICVSEKDLYFCVTYIPPEDSTVYTTVYSDLYDFDFFEHISDDVRSQCDQGDVFITGDSNIRTSDRPDYVENINLQRYVTKPGIEEYIVPSRKPQDKHINNVGQKLLSFCKEHNLSIVNGRLDDGKCTCSTVNRSRSGCSLVDYLIMNHDLFLFH